MAATILLGNVALLVDASSTRVAMATERFHGGCVSGKGWLPELHMSHPTRKDPAAVPAPLAAQAMGFHDAAESSGEPSASSMMARRRRRSALSKVAASTGYSGNGGNGEDDDESLDWEENLRSRLKELEEMKELEKRAEELVAEGAGGDEEETEEEKRERVRRELEKVAKEQAERRKTAKLMFELGQKAYGKGMYSRAIDFLEAALTIVPGPTLLGGEIQIWLAMAYEANNRHRDCIALYKQLEKSHPSVSIRRQAAELRYILQAPKLKISKDEMVTIPLIGSSYDRYAGTWSDKFKDQEQRRKTSNSNQLPLTDNYWGDFLNWREPSELPKSPAFWLIVALWFGLIGTAILLQR
ncbi:uncharacterized protein LOC122055947 isoform X1 [Zingiber officinale]|uniref:uncharacterized protein LOC122055947 isoform X1 n=1 Tax=Zingiber officinale TaxID=94328 RepID=UPI001C4AC2BE|nr:uncharacterized protein LOC122055947 isoform X1 [Zingiber officinale]